MIYSNNPVYGHCIGHDLTYFPCATPNVNWLVERILALKKGDNFGGHLEGYDRLSQ